jgi:DNA polymerase-3 subunit delta
MSLITVSQLLQRLSERRIAPVYLLFGEEPYLIQEYVTVLIERILEGAPYDFNCDVFSADSDILPEALDITRTLPMMASHRVVVLHGLQQLGKDDMLRLEGYAEHPSESTALICSSTDSDPKSFPTRLWQKALAVACPHLEGAPLHDWIRTQANRYGCAIADDAVQAFSQDQQHDLWIMRQEIDKLCTYVGEAKTISVADMHAVCYTSRQQSIFALSDAIGTRQIPQAFTFLEQLLIQGEPPLVVFSMLVRHLRLLWSVRQLLQQSQDHAHIAKALGLPLPVCRRLVSQSRHFPLARLRQLYTATIEADIAFKTTNKPPAATLEGLILELCASS